MAEDDVLFPPLLKKDVVQLTITSDKSTLGSSKKHVSWIWNEFKFNDGDNPRYKAFFDDGEYPLAFTPLFGR